MKKLVQIVLCFSIILSISIVCHSCKSTDTTSELSQVSCACNDVQCWEKLIDKQSKNSLQCSWEYLSAATSVKLIDEATELARLAKNFNMKFYEEFFTTIKNLAEGQNWQTVFTEIARFFKYMKNVKCPECDEGAVNAIVALFNVFQPLLQSDSTSQDSESLITTIVNNIQYAADIVSLANTGIETVTSCFKALATEEKVKEYQNSKKITYLTKAFPKIVNNLDKLITPVAKMAGKLLTFVTLAQCGYNIGGATVTLFTNSTCLASELWNVAFDTDTQAFLGRAYDRMHSLPLACPKDEFDPITSYNSNTHEIDKRYGIALHKYLKSTWTWSWDTTLCKYYCNSVKGRMEGCFKFSLGSNLKGNLNDCQRRCTHIPMTSRFALDGGYSGECTSHCCGGDTSCYDTVKKKSQEEWKNLKK